jgi:hypothetical protein
MDTEKNGHDRDNKLMLKYIELTQSAYRLPNTFFNIGREVGHIDVIITQKVRRERKLQFPAWEVVRFLFSEEETLKDMKRIAITARLIMN